MKLVKMNPEDIFGGDNACLIIGKYQKLARRQGLTKPEIDAVINEAKKGDYDHLVATFEKYTE